MKSYIEMKKLLMGLILVLVLLGISSCEKKLEQYPKNQFAKETFWTNETNAMIALTGVYRGNLRWAANEVNPSDWWSYAGLILFEHATDNAFDRRGANAGQNRLTNGTLLPNNATISYYWLNSFVRIAICNDFLENVGSVNMSETTKKRMIAETRFIRAAQYFYLSQWWGAVPLVTKTLTPDEANVVTKTSRSEIVNFVINEFTEAAIDVPRYKDLSDSESGRVSKQAVLAFLGRIYLQEKNFTDASNAYKQIIDFGDNIIDSDYGSLFNTDNEKSAENIFSTKYKEGVAGNFLTQHALPANMGGYHLVNPFENLAVEYDFIDGTPFSYDDTRFNPKNMAQNRDPRFAATFLWDGCVFNGRVYDCHPDHSSSLDQLTYSKQATRTGYGLRKFFHENFTGNLTSGNGADMPIIRYAEVLLSYLEAELEGGKPITQELLDMTINKIRGRASVQMPPIDITNPDLLRPILRKERRIELALEGIRYWDLLRWGILGDVMQGDFWGASFPDAINTGSKVDPTGNKRWWVDNKAFRKGQDEVWPIPQSEQDINPNLRDD